MRVFKTRWFARFARRQGISDRGLADAVRRAQRGLVDADLGGGVIKQRIARQGQGRSSGYRVLMAYRRDVRTVFIYGFAKNERDNVDDDELATTRDIAQSWLAAEPSGIARAVADQLLHEVKYDDQTQED